MFEVRFDRTEPKTKLYLDQNKVFFIRFLLIFLEMHLREFFFRNLRIKISVENNFHHDQALFW